MRVYFEELSSPKRAGGIEAACGQLAEHARSLNVQIIRSAGQRWDSTVGLPDCVHFQGLWSPVLARRFFYWKRYAVPCVLSPHGMLEPWALSHKYLRKKIAWSLYQKSILNRCNVIHATSEGERAQLVKLGVTAKIEVIPWGVVAPASFDRQRVSGSRRVALFAGRLCPVKGLPMLFEAWKSIQPSGWCLCVVGPDESGYRASLEATAKRLGIQGQVSFTGALSRAELDKAFLNADLFVLPSHSENFGMVVGEALALGLPVITTQSTPWKRIADTGCGWWVPANANDLAIALEEATAKTSSELGQMGSIGAELIRREYSWEQATAKFNEMYAQLGAKF